MVQLAGTVELQFIALVIQGVLTLPLVHPLSSPLAPPLQLALLLLLLLWIPIKLSATVKTRQHEPFSTLSSLWDLFQQNARLTLCMKGAFLESCAPSAKGSPEVLVCITLVTIGPMSVQDLEGQLAQEGLPA